MWMAGCARSGSCVREEEDWRKGAEEMEDGRRWRKRGDGGRERPGGGNGEREEMEDGRRWRKGGDGERDENEAQKGDGAREREKPDME